MMIHILERYFTNTENTEVGDRMCEGVLMAIINEGRKVMANPEDYDARANIMWSGMVAHNGTCGVGREEDWSSHALEHEISAIYDVTHGAGLSVIFPAWMTWMVTHNIGKLVQFAVRVWDVPQPSSEASDAELQAVAQEGILRLKQFFRSLALPTTFAELGIPHPDIDRMIESLRRNKGELLGNYVKLTMEQCKEIYRLAE